MKIFINYKDSSKNIDLNLTNKEDEEIAKLKDSLESNFYKFNYEVNKENQITVNIERYVLEDKPENAEKNSEIILKGNKDLNLIKKVNSKVDYENYNYIFENEMVGEKEISVGEIYSLNFLLVYDKEDTTSGPMQNLTGKVQPGQKLHISAKVKYETGPDFRKFNVTMQYGTNNYAGTDPAAAAELKKVSGERSRLTILFLPMQIFPEFLYL